MKFLATLSALAAAVTVCSAAPAGDSVAGTSLVGPPKKFTQYYVQISGSEFDGRYVAPYHTGAGMADATLETKEVKAPFRNYINGTDFITIFPAGGKKYYPYGWTLAELTFYTTYQPVQINTGYGTKGFYVEDGKLLSKFSEWKGWRVCRFWHDNTPQLFYNLETSPLTCNCAGVDLVLVKADD